ncbi:hypothetical protein [Natronomonas sp. EA1]|uniref:hypothetical protein n=1 Tax=Natronomonas sp. EA1 TaxID=3421655 RepID=UPI003EBBFD62
MHRRHLLSLLAAGGLAGCTSLSGDAGGGSDAPDSSASSTATPTPEPLPMPDDIERTEFALRVRFPAVTDAEASVRDGTIRYPELGVEFHAAAAYEGTTITDRQTSQTLRVARELPKGVPTVFIAPVFLDGTFEYRIYATDAFVGMADWTLSVGTTEFETSKSRPLAFERHFEYLNRAVVEQSALPGADPREPLAVFVANYPYDRVSDSPDDVTGVLSRPDNIPTTSEVPQANFSFAYDGAVTVRHEGGDTLDAANLTVVVGNRPAETQFSGEVRAGDAITVSDVDLGTTVYVVWSKDGRSEPLAQFVVSRDSPA